MMLLCLVAGACRRKSKLPQPVTPALTTVPLPPAGPLNPPPESLPDMQPPQTPRKSETPPVEQASPGVKQEKKQAPPRRIAPKAADTPVEVAAPSPPPPQQKPPDIPQLAPVITEQETRDFNRSIDAALTRAEQNLRGVRTRDRNSKQQLMLDQAEAFAQQARETRSSDPVGAKSLADRAEQLSRELVSSFR